MEINQLWKNVCEELKVVMASNIFQMFFSKTQLVTFKDNVAIISCPNSYIASMNKQRYLSFVKSAFDNQTKSDITIEFIIQEAVPSLDLLQNAPLFTFTAPKPVAQSSLHPKYTFDNLIVGNSNNFAFAAAQGIVKNPGISYNPFFIWGGVGVGKTHLMQAIGHELLRSNPSLKVRYFPAETFGNELISSLKGKTINQFKDKYRQLDCILVDDIQFIAGKEYIQEEFFHTFNALHMAGKQVILTSDRKPGDIDKLEDRLVSRFMGGLTVDIQPPDYEMRSAIIMQKASEKGIDVDLDAVQFLADNLQSNTRDIEGRIQEIAIKSISLGLTHINKAFVENFFHPESNSTINNFNASEKLTPRHLISVCAKHFNVKTGELTGNSRKKELVSARHITAYLLLTETKLPLKEVGNLLGGRDHTSIMHARDKVTSDITTNNNIRQLINQIKSSL